MSEASKLQDWLAALPDHYREYRKPGGIWSMTTRRELCFCETYARECFSGAGIMVDLGCWFGATTFCFAKGLSQNNRAKQNRIIKAFDLFLWQDWMCRIADSIQMPIKYRAGESFFRDVQELLAPYQENVELHQEDLLAHQPTEESIEMLFIDAMKSWPLAEKIVEAFFPRLIPGVSVVVQQDFVYHAGGGAMNHLFMWRLRDYFEAIHFVPQSASLAFVCTKPIARTDLSALAIDSFTLEEIELAYEYSVGLVPEERGQILIEAAKLGFLIWRGYDKPALAQAERLTRAGVKFSEQIVSDTRALMRQRQSVASKRHDAATQDYLQSIESCLLELSAPPAANEPERSDGFSRVARKFRKFAPWKRRPTE
jgi:predicted O-methyltransferase YrrM